jgi:hypothetical protein
VHLQVKETADRHEEARLAALAKLQVEIDWLQPAQYGVAAVTSYLLETSAVSALRTFRWSRVKNRQGRS